MKNIIVTVSVVLCALSMAFSQEETREKVGFKSVEAVESYINAVEVKIEHVKSDPDRKKEAEEMGWFEQMEKNLEEARRQKAILEEKENK